MTARGTSIDPSQARAGGVSNPAAVQPVFIHWPASIAWFIRFVIDPVGSIRRLHRSRGPLVLLRLPWSRRRRYAIFAADAAVNRIVHSDPETWRPMGMGIRGPRGHASRRLRMGLVRLQGERHRHYRRLLAPRLRPAEVEGYADKMAPIAEEETGSWPEGATFDLQERVHQMVRRMAMASLFGGDLEGARGVADLIERQVKRSWSPWVYLLPIRLPGTPYWRWLRLSEQLEARIVDWVRTKRGQTNPDDIVSVFVNTPDESANPPDDAAIVGHFPALFLGAYDTCENALIAALVLLNQHPRVAAEVREEIRGASAGGRPRFDRLARLPLLEGVVQESLRLMPPLPIQFRIATRPTSLFGIRVPDSSLMILGTIVTNRAPERFPQPERFRPERWSQEPRPTPFECPVFSAGPRSCPGFAFGNTMVKIAIASIISRYTIEIVPSARIDYRYRLTLTPDRGVPTRLHPANGLPRTASLRGNVREFIEVDRLDSIL